MRIKRLIINKTPLIFLLFFCMLPNSKLKAQEEPTQLSIDESFDPFADYNEYEQDSEQEADIHFLRNGRYLTLAFAGGYRSFIGGGFAEAYRANIHYGMEFSYFFNLNLAMSLGFTNSDHNVNFASYTSLSYANISKLYTGNVNIQNLDLQAKYYFDTDNVTKGLADLNPYALLGGSYNTRTYSLDETLGSSSDQVWGLKLAGGIEIPLLKRSAYMGIQLAYRYVQFPDENKSFIEEDDSGDTKPIRPRLDGDFYDLSVMIGLNF